MRSLPVAPRRCAWCGDDPLYVAYHDREWGFPVADDPRLFEKICLEGFQSGLSWLTILRKRDAFRDAFFGFDYERVAKMGARDVQRLLGNAAIVRHRGKIESTINNAKRAREIKAEHGSLAADSLDLRARAFDAPEEAHARSPADDGDVAGDLMRIPLDDPKTYAMLERGETVGVFQLESAGMRKALAEMRADRFEDIIALVALYRPGPMANIPVYCAVKRGEEDADYIHPKIEPVLKETFGVIIYQEQVMQIAQILAGFSLGEADLLRRAMGKKIKAEMAAQRDRFVSGAAERGLAKAKANEIFDLLAKFADYGFNKSHAAAYALIAYQTAYLKANYPVEFLAASMTLDKSNTDKLAEFCNESRRLDIKILPPSVQTSGADFEPAGGEGAPAIRYALSAIKGVGESHARSLAAINASGDRRMAGKQVHPGKPAFRDLSDFAAKLNPREINKRTLEKSRRRRRLRRTRTKPRACLCAR